MGAVSQLLSDANLQSGSAQISLDRLLAVVEAHVCCTTELHSPPIQQGLPLQPMTSAFTDVRLTIDCVADAQVSSKADAREV